MSEIEFRTYDGSENNLAHPDWGRANTRLLRLTTPAYVGRSELSGPDRPNPRVVSNIVCRQPAGGGKPSPARLSDYNWAWGQFLDHELVLTGEAEPAEPRPIPIPADDPQKEFRGKTIPFKRSIFDPATGICTGDPRQQLNQLASYVDAANVYGADPTRAGALRLFDGSGRLKFDTTAKGVLLPKNTAALPNAKQPPGSKPGDFFLAGDDRTNEHTVLICLHTLFLREHNRWCEVFANLTDTSGKKVLAGDDEAIFQRARKTVGAVMQRITFSEFLPALLGKDAFDPWGCYNPHVDASISNLFSTAAYRFGHSTLSPQVLLGASGPGRPLRELFFQPKVVETLGIEPFLEGLGRQVLQDVGVFIIDDVREFLFRNVNASTLLDLPALNIQRGRDHGLPSYNQCRRDFGLPPKRSFQEITSDEEVLKRLKKAYGDVELIDPWVGGLAERYVAGANVGELIRTVLIDQFSRLRDGDRFWYENDPFFRGLDPRLAGVADTEGSKLLGLVEASTLSAVVKRNTSGITSLPDDVFHVPAP